MDKDKQIAILIKRVADNDKIAYIELMELLQADLLKTAYSYLGDIMLSEDILNDVFLELPYICSKIKNTYNIIGWFRTIVINKSLTLIRKRKREYVSNSLINKCTRQLQSHKNPIDDVIIRDCLAHMPENERTVLILRSYDYTFQEISDATGFTIKKIRILLDKAKKNFLKNYKN